jgi:hypothetical protein
MPKGAKAMHVRKFKVKMVRFVVFIICTVIIPFTARGIAGSETVKFRIFTYTTRMESMPIGFFDAPTNILCERMGFINYENGDVARFISRATGKNNIQEGTREGYALITYSDNSTSVFEWKLHFTTSVITQLKTFDGSGEFIKGTGRYAGIKGEVSLVGHEVIPLTGEPKGGAYFDVIATYTVPPTEK